MDEWILRLSDDALARIADATILERGRAYAANGSVSVRRLALQPSPSIDAVVTGSERYAVRIGFDGTRVAGGCTCPHAAEGWFCKHQVAVALELRARLAGEGSSESRSGATDRGPSPDRVAEIDERAALQTFLAAQPRDVLVDRLMRLADEDFEIERELQEWRALDATDPTDRSVEPLIDEILGPVDRFIERRETTGWARRARAVLPLLAEAAGRDPRLGLRLAQQALALAWAALQEADDSDGAMAEVCAAIGRAWLDALRESGPRPDSFGEAYLELLLADPIGSIDASSAEAALGPEALARFRSVLAARWRDAMDTVLTLKARSRPERPGRAYATPSAEAIRIESDTDLWSLEHHHLRQLEACGNAEASSPCCARTCPADARSHE